MDLLELPYDHADSATLIAALQQEYVVRYGGIDSTPVDPGEFAPPRGLFLVGYLDGRPVACGGWRVRPVEDQIEADGDEDGAGWRPGDVEIKRMFVLEEARGAGHSRRLLAELERTAADAGHRRIVLETGLAQPEAMGLYSSSGYRPIRPYGIHRCSERARSFAKSLIDDAADPRDLEVDHGKYVCSTFDTPASVSKVRYTC